MSYVSVSFFAFFLAVIFLYFAIPVKYRQYVLLAASLIFYIINSKFAGIFIGITAVSVYLLGLAIGQKNEEIKQINKELPKEERKKIKNGFQKKKKVLVFAACAVNIGFLIVLKYSGFFVSTFFNIIKIFGTAKEVPTVKFILPLGISYYTLMAISYIVDIYRARITADKNFARLLLYLTFFPCILEGPISTYPQLAGKLFEGHRFNKKFFVIGCQKVVWGLFKKMVIADRAAILVNEIFDNNQDYSGLVVVVAVFLYTVQIYAEFSGCIDIVSGISKMLGIDLPENFRQPFFSKSVQEFWRRWHITLGAWLKEYVFYSVSFSGGLKRFSKWINKHVENSYYKASIPMLVSLFAVWFITGIWHGASWKYVIYGLYYYVILSTGILAEPLIGCVLKKLKISRESKAYSLFQIVRTDLFVVFGLMLFRADTVSDMFSMLLSAVKGFNLNFGACIDTGVSLIDFAIIALGIIIMFIVSLQQEKGKNVSEEILRLSIGKKYLIYFAFIAFILFFGVYGSSYTMQPFVYGQF